MARLFGLCVVHFALSGCVIAQLEVRNPVPGLSTVAVAPFFNLSQERSVDGRRFALAYFTELQKVAGFQVVPVGVCEQAIFDHNLEMSNPQDAIRLAEILQVDAVAVGAVTDYEAYYPPRIGMQVSWYSPQQWTFHPDPGFESAKNGLKRGHWKAYRVLRAQSPEPSDGQTRDVIDYLMSDPSGPMDEILPAPMLPENPEQLLLDPDSPSTVSPGGPIPVLSVPRPFMSYTRMFDGADADLVATLRDYLELSGDRRSGGWEAYLHRSEDFLRFSSHLMISEMLSLHGGQTKRRFVVKLRKHR